MPYIIALVLVGFIFLAGFLSDKKIKSKNPNKYR